MALPSRTDATLDRPQKTGRSGTYALSRAATANVTLDDIVRACRGDEETFAAEEPEMMRDGLGDRITSP
jgi:hypothetical protein